MTEDEAKSWLYGRFGAASFDRVGAFVDMVVAENERQNLLSPASLSSIWVRHVVDSAQLLALAPTGATRWLDIGTGGGFPGMIVALLFPGTVTMTEPRRRRVSFLQEAADILVDRNRVSVVAGKVEQTGAKADVISARAVATVEKLLQASEHCATSGTRWILPRGSHQIADLSALGRRHGVTFHVEHSLTDERSLILLADRA